MKIASSNVALAGASQQTNTMKITQERLEAQGRYSTLAGAEAKLDASAQQSVQIFISEESRNQFNASGNGALLERVKDALGQGGKGEAAEGEQEALEADGNNKRGLVKAKNVTGTKPAANTKFEVKSQREMEFEVFRRLVSAMFGNGKEFKLMSPFKHRDPSDMSQNQNGMTGLARADSGGQRPVGVQGGFVTTIERTSVELYESESMSFSAQASVTTADGRSINIDLDLNMSRELYLKMDSETTVTESFQRLCDPLIINFGSETANLSDTKFEFDLDCDGTSDQISKLGSGSGFLALDKNEDGKINDGNELFGAKSGNGFRDLAAHDSDRNGWIDENDPVYDKLRVWMKDESGEDKLVALGEVGIGAVYLGYADTDYSLMSEGGKGSDLNGVIRKSGIFLREDGTAGTVQHVDMSV